LLSIMPVLLIGNPQRGTWVAVVALVIALTALLLARSAAAEARRAGVRRPRGARAGLVIGVIGALFNTCALVTFLAFGPQFDTYVNCLHTAHTTAEGKACLSQFVHSTENH
jgi:hypothetical protein